MFANLMLPFAAVMLLGTGVAFSDTAQAAEGKRPQFEKIMKELDANGDGTISAEESQASASKTFDEFDSDKDGSISLDEMDKKYDAEKAKREEERAKREAEMRKKFRDKVDPDGDGKVTKEEFMKSAGERQKKMDLNGDGNVTKQEIADGRKKMKEARKEKVNAHKGEGREGGEPKQAPKGE